MFSITTVLVAIIVLLIIKWCRYVKLLSFVFLNSTSSLLKYSGHSGLRPFQVLSMFRITGLSQNLTGRQA